MPWKRTLPLGQVWRRFRGRERDGRPVNTYQIRDIEDKDKERCIHFAKDIFLRDEPLCKYFNILSDPDSVSTILRNWAQYVSMDVSLACYVEDEDGDPGELVAVDICEVSCSDEEDSMGEQKGEPWSKLLPTLMAIGNSVDVFKHYDVDKYFSSHVMVVSPDHRGQNIGVEIFKATEDLARALGIKAMATSVTALSSQALTTKCGYEVLSEMPYSKMSEQGIDIKGCSTPSAKVVGTYLD